MKKSIAIFLQVMGLMLIVAFGVNMFVFFTMDDVLWLSMLLCGIMFFFTGDAMQQNRWTSSHSQLVFISIIALLLLISLSSCEPMKNNFSACPTPGTPHGKFRK
jgi:hypothetical protein